MGRYKVIKSVFGGSDVYDSNGNQVAYSLPSILGDGEDFYDMDGNGIGQSFDSVFGGQYFVGEDSSQGFFDEEIHGGQNLYMNGSLEKTDGGDLY